MLLRDVHRQPSASATGTSATTSAADYRNDEQEKTSNRDMPYVPKQIRNPPRFCANCKEVAGEGVPV